MVTYLDSLDLGLCFKQFSASYSSNLWRKLQSCKDFLCESAVLVHFPVLLLLKACPIPGGRACFTLKYFSEILTKSKNG